MTPPYTKVNLGEVDDSAPGYGFGEIQEARFATGALGTTATGVCLHRLHPGRRAPFAHRHAEAEEVYVVVGGSGRIRLDDDVVELGPLDAVRVAPQVTRQLESGPDGLQVLALGPRHEGDGELVHGWWID